MKLSKVKKLAAHVTTGMLKAVILSEANSTSSLFIYQPKVPEALSRYRKDK